MKQIVIKTIPTKYYQVNDVREFKHPLRIDWGDGTITLVDRTSQIKHKFKKEEEHTIIFYMNDDDIFKFTDDDKVRSVEGALPYSNDVDLTHYFRGCENLEYVDNDFFINNVHHTNISFMCEDCYRLKSIKFILRLVNAKLANYIFRRCLSVVDYSILSEWGEHIEEFDGALSENIYMSEPEEDILHSMVNLISAKYLFYGNENITGLYHAFFMDNIKLKHIDYAFVGCNIKDNIDPNWLYYLPNSVETDRTLIFDENVKLNGM